MKKSRYDIDWAEIIDLFASEYGWTMDYTSTLDLSQVMVLMDAIKKRRDRENNSSEGETPSTNKVEGVSSDEKEVPISYFEQKVGGKKVVVDGVTKIII